MKSCSKCGVEKPLEDFFKRPETKDGRRTDCKVCRKKEEDARKAKDPEAYRQRDRNYGKAYRERDPEKVAKNVAERRKRYIERHPDRQAAIYAGVLAKAKIAYKADPDKFKQRKREWQKRNPGKVREINVNKKAKIRLATPKWLTKEQRQEIKQIYGSAQTRSEFHEVDFHVDHIEPINGKISRGLHVPWNLRVYLGTDNVDKSNKLEQPVIINNRLDHEYN